MTWAVVQCEPMREGSVRRQLMRQELETYAPLIRMRQGKVARVARLFPGYVFVRIGEQWHALFSTIGVIRPLMSGDHPHQLPETIIKEIKAREDRHGFVRLPIRRLRRGQRVRVVAGSFIGQSGMHEDSTSEERVRILLDILGRKVPVELPLRHVEPITTTSCARS